MKGDPRPAAGMARPERDVDRHTWETRFADLDGELRVSPAEALPELLALVEEIVRETREPSSLSAVEVETVLQRARELVRLRESGGEVPNDDAFQAAAELRTLYRALVDDI